MLEQNFLTVNTLIEFPIAWLFFRKNIAARKLLLVIFTLNIASALAGAITVAIVYGLKP